MPTFYSGNWAGIWFGIYHSELWGVRLCSCLSKIELKSISHTRVLTGFNRWHHNTRILASLNWLPVRFITDFKISSSGSCPKKQSRNFDHEHMSLFTAMDPRVGALLTIPKSRLKPKGNRAFVIKCPPTLQRPTYGEKAYKVSNFL